MQKNEVKEAAKLSGLAKYFDGKPCKYGHISERYTRNSACVACELNKKQNPESLKRADAKYKAANKEKLAAKQAERRARNPELHNQRTREWRAVNPEKVKAYTKATLPQQLARTKKRRTLLIQRMPAWADEKAILDVYEEAARISQETGILHHVDHYYPLQGETVCGLHVHSNLQIITAEENLQKSNKHPDDFYGKQVPRESCNTSDAQGSKTNQTCKAQEALCVISVQS